MRATRLGGLFALAVLAHVESLSYWFVSTDTFGLVRSSRVRSTGDLAATFTRPMMHGTGFTDIALFYRPLTSLSFALDYWLWGLTPAGYHATNLVLHGLVVVLAAVAIAEVTRQPAVGVVAAALFALHPLTAEVVPVIARRQDAIMLVFLLSSLALFVRARRTGTTSLLSASVVAYGLALTAKEPALLLPGLVFGWVVLDEDGPWNRDAPLAALYAVVPYALVTAGYLAVRVAVLDGLGGYLERPSLTAGDLPALLVKYALSMWYPVDPVAASATAGGVWWLVPAVLVGLAALFLAWAVPATAETGMTRRQVPLLGFTLGIALVPALLAVDPVVLRPVLEAIGYGGPGGDLPFAYPYQRPVSALVGLALVGATASGAVWVVLAARSALDPSDWTALAFFAFWLLLPLGLFYRSGDYAVRSGYPSLVPAMALLAVLLVAGARAVRSVADRRAIAPRATTDFDADAAQLVVAAMLLVVPLVATSPLIHPYDGWRTSGEINRMTLSGLEGELETAPTDDPVQIVGLPTGIEEQRRAFPRVGSIGYLKPGSVEAWLALKEPGGARSVTASDPVTLERPPDGVTFDTTVGPEGVRVHVRYE